MNAHIETPRDGIVLVHAYFELNLEREWEVVQRDIPRLITLIEPLVPPEAG